MQQRQFIKFEYCFAQSAAEVFAFFSEHNNLGKIWPAKISRIRDGFNPKQKNGIGSVRQVKIGPYSIEETIVSFVENKRIEYAISKNSPFKSYRGIMEFFAIADNECLYRHSYHIEQHLPLPTWLTRQIINRTIASGMTKAEKLIQS